MVLAFAYIAVGPTSTAGAGHLSRSESVSAVLVTENACGSLAELEQKNPYQKLYSRVPTADISIQSAIALRLDTDCAATRSAVSLENMHGL